MNWRETPCYIVNHDNLARGFQRLLAWLQYAGMTNINVIDNASTYPPLLDFYASPGMAGINLIHAGSNLGHEAMWKLGLHLPPTCPDGTRYILTDPDLVPASVCPLDLVCKMHEIADRHAPAKVGPSIRIDNLPDCFANKAAKIEWESVYWTKRIDSECWDALIDTTFALYDSGWERWSPYNAIGAQHIRLDFPYVIEHLPWYEDSADPSPELRYYRSHVAPGFSSAYPLPEPE